MLRGATALNYAEAVAFMKNGSKLDGVVTKVENFRAPVVINAAGPWSREVALRLDRDRRGLMAPSLAFNLLLDIAPPSEAAVAVESDRVYFVTPHRSGMTFAGTMIWPR